MDPFGACSGKREAGTQRQNETKKGRRSGMTKKAAGSRDDITCVVVGLAPAAGAKL
jgi:hypothetical protein